MTLPEGVDIKFDFCQELVVFKTRAGNSVYLGNQVASQKKAQEPKTQEEGKKEEMGREKKKRRGVRRGKKDQTNMRTQKKQGGI